jgi:hypothetical protein
MKMPCVSKIFRTTFFKLVRKHNRSRDCRGLRKQFVLRRFTYGKYGGMLKFALHGYRIEEGAYFIRFANPFEAVSPNLRFDNRW